MKRAWGLLALAATVFATCAAHDYLDRGLHWSIGVGCGVACVIGQWMETDGGAK